MMMQNKNFIKSEPFLQGGDVISDVNVCWVVLIALQKIIQNDEVDSPGPCTRKKKKKIFAKKYIQGLKQEQGQEP